MAEYDLKQLRADLDTIRSAAGISEGPTRHDLLWNALIALAGLVVAGWAMLSHGVWQLGGFVAVVLPVSYLIGLRVRHRKASGGSPQIRREFAQACAVLSLAVPFVAYVLWAQRMKIPPMLVLATSVFFVGMIMLNGVIGRPRRLELAPWCLALMVGALAIPSTALSPVTVIGAMLTAGGLVSACVVGIRLRHGRPDGISG
jgi:F0F1-type ATP synthase assembly protein I